MDGLRTQEANTETSLRCRCMPRRRHLRTHRPVAFIPAIGYGTAAWLQADRSRGKPKRPGGDAKDSQAMASPARAASSYGLPAGLVILSRLVSTALDGIRKMKNSFDQTDAACCAAVAKTFPDVPHYLQANYWWAYVHPHAVTFFERQWLVNLILWGNYKRLCNAVLNDYGHNLMGRTLQIACAYGDLTPRLAQRVAPDGLLEIVDIPPIQPRICQASCPRICRSSCTAWTPRHSLFPTRASTGRCCSSCSMNSRRRCARKPWPKHCG